MKTDATHRRLLFTGAFVAVHALVSCGGELDEGVAALSSAVPVASSARLPNTYPKAPNLGAGGAAPARGGVPATTGGSGGNSGLAGAGGQPR